MPTKRPASASEKAMCVYKRDEYITQRSNVKEALTENMN